MKNKLGLGLDRVGGTFIPSVSTPATMFANDDFFWINTARSPVTLDGSGNIELIENLGTFGGDMQQTEASNRMGYGITTLNGKPVADADGVSEFLESTLPAGDWAFLHDGTLYSVLTVFKPGNGADPDDAYYLLGTGIGSDVSFFIFYDNRSSMNHEDTLRHRVSISGGSPVDNITANGYAAANAWHHGEFLADPSNATAADRSIITADDQSEEKNNSSLESPSSSDPYHTLQIGKINSNNVDVFYTGQFAETIIVKGRHVTQAELDWFRTDWTKREWGL